MSAMVAAAALDEPMSAMVAAAAMDYISSSVQSTGVIISIQYRVQTSQVGIQGIHLLHLHKYTHTQHIGCCGILTTLNK